jgi:hypothetical protein
MNAALKSMLGLLVVLGLVLAVGAAEDEKKEEKEKTLKGTLGCGKCVFKITKACSNAIKVKEGDKEVVYIFIDKGKGEKYHSTICTSEAAGSVTGVVSKKDKQDMIKPAKDSVKFD